MQTYAENRPYTPIDEAYLDLKKFEAYLKGEMKQDASESIKIPGCVSDYILEKIKAISPIKSLSRITHTNAEKLDVVIDRADFDQSGWITDNQAAPEKEGTVKKTSIELHELFARPKVTQRLIGDSSIKIEDFIKDKIISQMAAAENKAFLFGDGTNQPRGILSYDLSCEGPADQKIEAIKTGEKGKIEHYIDLIKVMELLPSQYLCNAVWLMSRNAASAIRKLKDETSGLYLWQNSIAFGVPNTLLGYPVVVCDDMEKLSTSKATTPVLFGNFYEAYHIAERQDITIIKDPYNSKPFVEFYATKRIGGDIVNFDAIKALRCEE
ncbi:MAG: phage major capsid protein [Holosporales bacterium]|nr:phage major capsid protein [Holosporales bacterium]